MKLIESSCRLIVPETPLKHVEWVGRICWESHDKMNDGSTLRFCKMLIANGHTTPFEHVCVKVPFDRIPNKADIRCIPYGYNHRVEYKTDGVIMNGRDFITFCNGTLEELDTLPVSGNSFTFELTIPIKLSREFVRHRIMSFMERSTRYVDLAKDGGISFVVSDRNNVPQIEIDMLECAEMTYRTLLQGTVRREDANDVLPLCTATRLIMTGTKEQWESVFKLRCDSHAHHDMQKIACEIRSVIDGIEQ